MFPSINLGNSYDGCWPTWLTSSYYFCNQELVFLSLTHLQCFIVIGYGFWDTGAEVPLSIFISVRGVVPMVVSSWANWESYSFSISPSFVSIFYFSLWCGGLKVSGLTFSAIILSRAMLCVVCEPGFTGDCGILSMGGSICPMYSPLLNVMCLFGVIRYENIHRWSFL